MTDSLTIPYQYKVLLLGLFSYTSCSVIAGALLLGLLTQTLVVTTFLAIVVTLIYEHRIRKTTHLKNTTETPLLLPLTTLPYSYGQLTGDLISLKQACQNALAHNHTIRITLPALDHTPFLAEWRQHPHHDQDSSGQNSDWHPGHHFRTGTDNQIRTSPLPDRIKHTRHQAHQTWMDHQREGNRSRITPDWSPIRSTTPVRARAYGEFLAPHRIRAKDSEKMHP